MKVDERSPLVVNAQPGKEGVDAGAEIAKKANDTPSKSVPNDRVVLSITNERLGKVNATIEQLPDVRKDKVAELKNRIEAGEYQVSGTAVAEKMLATMRKKPENP